MLQTNSHDRTHIMQLLAPSWLSGFLAVAAGILITGSVIIAFTLNSSTFQQQLITWQSAKPPRTLTTPDQELYQNDHPTLKGSWTLILVWSVVGLVTYTVAISIVNAVSNAVALKKSLNYVNAKPHSLIAETGKRLILRTIATIVLASLIYLFFKKVVPYAITAAHASAADFVSTSGIVDALVAFVVITFSVHLQAVFLRLSLGRLRVLSSTL